MDPKQSTEFNRRLIGLAELFDVKLSPQRMALYFEALRDLDLELVIRALNQAVKVCKFFPRPAELRDLVLGNAEDRVERAWMALRAAMGKAGAYASIVFDDAALGEAVVSMFGTWPNACLTELDEAMWTAKRKEFGRVYRVLVDRHLDGSRYLPGQCEQSNKFLNRSQQYVPIHRIGPDGKVTPCLPPSDGEKARIEIAAKSHEFSRLSDVVLKIVPKSMDETA